MYIITEFCEDGDLSFLAAKKKIARTRSQKIIEANYERGQVFALEWHYPQGFETC